MIVLYINGEHCTSLAQLKGYFLEDLTLESDIYADLLDYGRHGDIAKWFGEQGEPELSFKVAAISSGLSDSAFYGQLKAIITGMGVADTAPQKPLFDRCFSFEELKCDAADSEVKVHISLKVLMCVNEEYELRVSSNWGTRAMIINPHNHPEGKVASLDFIFRKRPGKEIGEITVMADGKGISQPSVSSSSPSFGNETIKDIIKKRKLSKILLALLSAADL